MKVHKVELLVIDFDDIGADDVKTIIENNHYPNHCMSPDVLSIVTKDCGDWDDDHPLNNRTTRMDAIEKLFSV